MQSSVTQNKSPRLLTNGNKMSCYAELSKLDYDSTSNEQLKLSTYLYDGCSCPFYTISASSE
jgi:hypothetical protein